MFGALDGIFGDDGGDLDVEDDRVDVRGGDDNEDAVDEDFGERIIAPLVFDFGLLMWLGDRMPVDLIWLTVFGIFTFLGRVLTVGDCGRLDSDDSSESSVAKSGLLSLSVK